MRRDAADNPARPADGRNGSDPSGRGAVVWASGAQAESVPALLDACGLEAIAAGAPDGTERELAGRLGCAPIEDLRGAIGSVEAAAFLLLDAGDFGDREDARDAEAVRRAAERGALIVSASPLPASLPELAGGRWQRSERGLRPIEHVRLAPLPRRSRVWPEVAELLADLIATHGPSDSARLACVAPPGTTRPGLALLGAVDLLEALLGEPELIDAAKVGGRPDRRGRRSLSRLTGAIHALARTADGRAATLVAGAARGGWAWSAHAEGPWGSIEVTPAGFALRATGADAPDHRLLEPGPADLDEPWASLAWYVRTRLASGGQPDAPLDINALVCAADAALLSAATGEAASPQTARRAIDPGHAGLW